MNSEAIIAESELSTVKLSNLKKMLKERHLPVTGNKVQLIARLREAMTKDAQVEETTKADNVAEKVEKVAKVSEVTSSAGSETSNGSAVKSDSGIAVVEPTDVATEKNATKDSTVATKTESPKKRKAKEISKKETGTPIRLNRKSIEQIKKQEIEEEKAAIENPSKLCPTSVEAEPEVKKVKKSFTPITFGDSAKDITVKVFSKPVEVKNDDATAKEAGDAAKNGAKDDSGEGPVSNGTTESNGTDKPMNELTQEEKLARRAEKYGITVTNSESKKDARAKRFGISKDGSGDSKNGNKLNTNVEVNLDVIKKRAERFGVVTSKTLIKDKESSVLEMRKQRFNSMNPEEKEKMEKRAKRFGIEN